MISKFASTLTYQQSAAARATLTLSQKNVIDQSGLPAHKLKQFEAGRYRLDVIDQKKLRDFYEARGADFDEIDARLKADLESDKAISNQQRDCITPNAGAGFLISHEVSQDQVDRVLDRMDENDSCVAELVGTAYESGMLGGVSEASESALREVFGLLAESHLLFRFLQGKSIVATAPGEPKTIGDMLSNWVKDSPAYGVFALAGAESETAEVGA